MSISRRAFRLFVAIAIGTAAAQSYATDREWESGAEAYTAAAVCPYGACHSGRDYLADPVPTVIDVTPSETTPTETAPADVASEAAVTAPADSIATENAIAETSAPAARADNANTTSDDADNGYDKLHPGYGHPFYGHSYYQRLQYGHGLCHDEARALQEATCQTVEPDQTVTNEATEPVADVVATDDDAVPPTPVEESLPAEATTANDEAPIGSEEVSNSATTAVVELAEEPVADIEADVTANEATSSAEPTSETPVVESLTPSPYPYGHGHPVYSSKGYPFHYLNQPYDASLPAHAAAAAETPTADNAHCDPAPEYDWEAVANSNCDQDEALRKNAEANTEPAENVDNYSDLLPSDDLPNYDYPVESQPTVAAPIEVNDSLDIDQIEFDGEWPADEPLNIGWITSSITLVAQLTDAVRDGVIQIEVPAWLSTGLEAAIPAATDSESTSVSTEAEPQLDQQTDIAARRDAVLAMARSIEQIGLSLQNLARHMERIADDDVIGRLGTPTDRIER